MAGDSPFEQEYMRSARKQGWLPIGTGWPDFALVGEDGRLVVAEVKGPKDKLRDTQYAMLVLLEDAGLDVRVADHRASKDTLGRQLSDDEREVGRKFIWSWTRSSLTYSRPRMRMPVHWINDRIKKEAERMIGHTINQEGECRLLRERVAALNGEVADLMRKCQRLEEKLHKREAPAQSSPPSFYAHGQHRPPSDKGECYACIWSHAMECAHCYRTCRRAKLPQVDAWADYLEGYRKRSQGMAIPA